MSGAVVHGDLVYLSGQVPADFSQPLDTQVKSTLDKVDALLKEAGTDKSKLISAQLWLKVTYIQTGDVLYPSPCPASSTSTSLLLDYGGLF